jgi:hypothetical protein
MDIHDSIRSQFHASLDMLQNAIEVCPEDMWDRADDLNRTWQVAYHTLFYTHFYLQPNEAAFQPWARQEDHYRAMGKQAKWLGLEDASGEPLDKAGVLEYLTFCREQVDLQTPSIDPNAKESGFDWLPMGKLELQFYNIRHIMQHTGELFERLSKVDSELRWVGMGTQDEER